MGDPIDIGNHGKLSIAADPKAPLLVVFGGVDVDGVHSGVYMWNYMNTIKDRFHVFVASSHAVNGANAYRDLMQTVTDKTLTPSTQILYLFSGGYRPGMDLLSGNGAGRFSSVFLVDIWMGTPKKEGKVITYVPDFYKGFVDANAAKTTYVYTSFAAVNDRARDYIAGKARSFHVDGSNMAAHLSTNNVAVSKLP